MRNGSTLVRFGPRRLRGLGDDYTLSSNKYKRFEQDLGKPISAMALKTQLSKTTCARDSTFGYSGAKAWVDKGCRGVFDVSFGSSGAYPDYALADRNLQALIGKIQACTSSPNVAVPSSWQLPAPDGKAPAAVVAAYNSYSLRLNSELPAARENAGVFCSAGAVSGSAGNPNATSPYQPQCGYDVYGRPLPCSPSGQPLQSAIIPGGDVYADDPVASDIYSHETAAQVNASQGGTDIVANPFAPPVVQAPAAPVTHPRRTASIAIGGVLLLAVGAFLLGKKRSSKRRVA